MTAPTPTTNPDLPFKVEGFATLVEGLDYAARGITGLNFFSSRGELETVLPYRELRRRALDLAGPLPVVRFRCEERGAVDEDTSR